MRTGGWAWLGLGAMAALAGGRGGAPARTERVRAVLASLPLRFEENRGQVPGPARFVHRAPGATLLLAPSETVLALGSRKGRAVLRTRLEGGATAPAMIGEEEQPGRSNYVRGRDPAGWTTGVAAFGRVRCAGVYPGIDLVYHGKGGTLEYDFEVAPGADPARVAMRVEGADAMAIDAAGDLVLRTAAGEVRQHAPVLYQEVAGERRAVEGRFALDGRGRVGFEVGAYDASRTLVIDPTLTFASYLGGNERDFVFGVALDAGGNVYVAGSTTSTDFPAVNAYDGSYGGIVIHNSEWFGDAFVTKINPAGDAILYSTYLGGTDDDHAYAIAVDASGNAYVTGRTWSDEFPTTVGAYRTVIGSTYWDGWVAKLGPQGVLVYSTFLGGQGTSGYGIAVDDAGSAYVTGEAGGAFPVVGPIPGTAGAGGYGAFVAKLLPSGAGLAWCSLVTGGGNDIQGFAVAVDAAHNCYAAGKTNSANWPVVGALQGTLGGTSDAFLMKINPAGNAFVYSTYLGGSSDDQAYGLALDAAGNAYVAGASHSTNFPTTPGALRETSTRTHNAFVAKVNAAGSALAYSTYLRSDGPAGQEAASGIGVDAAGNAYVVGSSHFNGQFPVVAPFQATNHGTTNGFVAKLDPAGGALLYATYVGGSVNTNAADGTYSTKPVSGCIAVDADGIAAVGGCTEDADFPATAGSVQAAASPQVNGWVGKIHPLTAPAAPTGLAVSALTATTVGLSWTDASAEESGFEIQRRVEDGEYAAAATPAADATGWTDTGREPLRGYGYRVRATNAAGPSAWVEVSTTTHPTLTLTATRGKLADVPEAGKDTFEASGTLAFGEHALDAFLDARADGLTLSFGDPDAPYVVEVPAIEGWKEKGLKLIWKPAAGQGFPRNIKLVLDFARGKFSLAEEAFDFPGAVGESVWITVRSGNDAGRSKGEWTPSARKQGRWSLGR